ncbi:glycosyltransferase family 1 protein [soil metagenome]
MTTESFLPTTNGVTTSVCRVFETLRERGHDAMVIAPAAGSPPRYAGFPVLQVPAFAYRQFPVGLPSPAVARALVEFSPDVVHVASPFLLGGQAIAAAHRLAIPSVAIYQTDLAGYTRTNRLSAATPLAWKVVRRIHERADVTLAPSSSALADLAAAGVPRLARWGRGVDLERYHPRNRLSGEANMLRRRIAPNNDVVIGYVGRLAPEKRVERLAALRGIRGIRIAIVGDGPAEASVRRALRGMPVTWLGRLGGEELATAYASFDLFVHTGTEETFGQTVQEAHASGLPVLAPRSGGPIDLIRDHETGILFEPHDDSRMRAAVELLVGEAGRRSVLGRSWSTVCDELIEHYRAVMTAVPREPPLERTAILSQVSRYRST